METSSTPSCCWRRTYAGGEGGGGKCCSLISSMHTRRKLSIISIKCLICTSRLTTNSNLESFRAQILLQILDQLKCKISGFTKIFPLFYNSVCEAVPCDTLLLHQQLPPSPPRENWKILGRWSSGPTTTAPLCAELLFR